MAWGIREPRVPGHVPGTTQYFDTTVQVAQEAIDGNHQLKTNLLDGQTIILTPQPSDDPNDPLNWPLWKRDLITFILSMTAIFATAQGSILAANTVLITMELGRQFKDVALLTGYFLMGCGAAAIFFVPSGRVWGKRHAFILGLVIIIASSAWASTVGKSYGSFVGARIVQGIGCAPFESLVNAAVGDLYYVHERGLRMAFTNLAVFGGSFFTPIVVGKISLEMGWKWAFIFSSIFLGVCLPLVFLFCPETSYRRQATLNTDIYVDENEFMGCSSNPSASLSDVPGGLRTGVTSGIEKIPSAKHNLSTKEHDVRRTEVPRPKSWLQSLSFFDGRKTDDSFFVLLLRPFPLLIHPAFLWACLIQGTMIGWTVSIGAIIAMIFQGPPYWWQEDKSGYTYVGPFVGAIVGFIVAGALSDVSVRYMVKRNNGVYEPEFRLILIVPMFIIGEIGLYGFGMTASEISSEISKYQAPVCFFGLQVCAMVIGAVASSLYIVDAYRDLAIEGFTISIIFKNFFSFFLTWYAFEWTTQGIGIRKTMIILASVQVFVCLTTIPIYIFGKRIRAYFHKHDMLKQLKLR